MDDEVFGLRGYALWQLIATDDHGQVWVPVVPDVRECVKRHREQVERKDRGQHESEPAT